MPAAASAASPNGGLHWCASKLEQARASELLLHLLHVQKPTTTPTTGPLVLPLHIDLKRSAGSIRCTAQKGERGLCALLLPGAGRCACLRACGRVSSVREGETEIVQRVLGTLAYLV